MVLPETSADHLEDWFEMLGKFGENVTPLPWKEIQAFNDVLKIDMEPWEAEALMIMSRSYCNIYHQAKEPNYPAPYDTDTDEIREQKAQKVSDGFKALAARKKSKKKRL